MKNEAKKPYRSAWSNAIWSFRAMLRETPASLLLMAAGVPLAVFLAWAEIRLPALVVAQVTTGQAFAQAAAAVGALLGATALADACRAFCDAARSNSLNRYRYRQAMALQRKSMRCFYQDYEKKSMRELERRAFNATMMWNGGVPLVDMPRLSLQLVQNALCYALLGTVISTLSPWLMLLLTAAPAVNWLCLRAFNKYEYSTRSARSALDSRHWYISQRAADFAAAKDVRVYGMSEWLRRIERDILDESLMWRKRLSARQLLARLAELGVILVRDGAAYVVLIRLSLDGRLTVEQFVLYFAAISSFAAYIGGIMSAWTELHAASLKLCDFREYLEWPEREQGGQARIEEHLKHAPEITFDRVSFRYEGAERDALHEVSFTLRAGERVALVGLNGAGKTTLVKLLCGLYRPASGEIRVDGVPVSAFPLRDYYRLFSPVFQEARTAFFSLAETVAGEIGEGVDRARAEACMRRAGLGRKLDSLPKGIDSRLDKQVNEEGVELSGGEAQKLMMARALYKDAPVLVLDEPTAALDPIAENEIYLQYRDMTCGKTSLFISHRLASTRFCDRILLLREGRVAEEGTHEQLLALGGEYARLYEMQSCWYRADDSKGGERA